MIFVIANRNAMKISFEFNFIRKLLLFKNSKIDTFIKKYVYDRNTLLESVLIKKKYIWTN